MYTKITTYMPTILIELLSAKYGSKLLYEYKSIWNS